MEFNKGMWLVGNPSNQPPDTTRINRNVVIRRGSGDIIPEPGFVSHDSFYNAVVGAKKTMIGEIALYDDDFIIFSLTPQGSSEIGILDKNGLYTYIYNDVALKFNKDYPIHGITYKNYKGERIIEFTDNYNPPRIVNIDNMVDYSSVDKMLLSRITVQPDINIDLINYAGTGLQTGAYYPICQYELNDFSTTDWFLGYNPVFITDDLYIDRYSKYDGSLSGINTDKAIVLNLSRINTDFNKLNVGYVQVKNGELFAYKTNTLKIEDVVFNENQIKTVLTGENLDNRVVLSLSEIQKIQTKFRRVAHLEQFQGDLLLGDVRHYVERNQQKQVNSLRLFCHSKLVPMIEYESFGGGLITINNKLAGYKKHEYNNEQRTFCHGEVYAFYVQFEFPWGWGQWWTMVGEELTDEDREVDTRFESQFKKYQINDTCEISNTGNGGTYFKFSKWENENEEYPKDGNYPTGKVRHFKFPSMQWLRKFVHQDSRMGVTHQSVLGIQLESIDLTKFKDDMNNNAISYRIGYAKRNNLNSSTLGQSIVIVNQFYDDDRPYQGTPNNYEQRYWASAGGNYERIRESTFQQFTEFDGMDKNNLRMYPAELLITKNNPMFNYIRKEYELRSSVEFRLNKINETKRSTVKDFTKGTSFSIGYTDADKMFAVRDKKYIPANVIVDTYDNLFQEEHLNVKIGEGENLMNFSPTAQWQSPEFNVIVTLLNVKKDYYTNFYQQQIVNCGVIKKNNEGIIYGGDMYHCDMSVNMYGRFTKGIDLTTDGTDEGNLEVADLDHKYNGIRSVKRFLISSFYNLNFRYVLDDKTKGYTDYYPVSGRDYLWNMKRDIGANDWINGYNKDYHVINDIEFGDVYNPMIPKQSVFPYRLFRSNKQRTQSLVNYHRMILSEDYYDMPSNRGLMKNIVAAQDYILIHFEKTLYKTRSRQKLQTSEGIEVQIGLGDIFEQPPIEVIHERLGMLGTQHKFSCYLTPYGYVFCDAEKRKWFLLSANNIEDLSNLENGSELFFYENSQVTGDNPYTNNGYSVGIDEKYKRLIISRKAKELKQQYQNKFKGIYNDTSYFIQSLEKGDIVFKDGKFQIVK